jgi:hypothetical protein
MSAYGNIASLDREDVKDVHDNVNMKVFQAILDSDFSEDKGLLSQIEACCSDKQKGWLIHRLPLKTNCNYLYKKVAEMIKDEEVHYELILLSDGILPRLDYSISKIKSLKFIQRLMYKRGPVSFEFQDLDPYKLFFESNREIGKFDYSFDVGFFKHPAVLQLSYLWRLFAHVDSYKKVKHLRNFVLSRFEDIGIDQDTYERDLSNEEDKLILYTLEKRADLINKAVDFLLEEDRL